ncbi:MAG: hypothetical protein GF344_09115, partial [Chitinivibrionales bacterium]|nr:hypothetical protein [Chitinivibrionales bacterium]
RFSGEYQFFARQVDALQARLNEHEAQLKARKKQQDIVSFSEQKQLQLQRLSAIKAQLQDTRTELIERNKRIEELTERRESIRNTISTGFTAIAEELERELMTQEVGVQALTDKEKALESLYFNQKSELERLNASEPTLNRLNRLIAVDTESLHLYQKKLEEARISSMLDSEGIINVKIVEPPLASRVPVKPKKLLVLSLGFILSISCGIATAMLMEYLSHTIDSNEDIAKHLGIPALASVPKEELCRQQVNM